MYLTTHPPFLTKSPLSTPLSFGLRPYCAKAFLLFILENTLFYLYTSKSFIFPLYFFIFLSSVPFAFIYPFSRFNFLLNPFFILPQPSPSFIFMQLFSPFLPNPKFVEQLQVLVNQNYSSKISIFLTIS